MASSPLPAADEKAWSKQVFNQGRPGSEFLTLGGRQRVILAKPRNNSAFEMVLAVAMLTIWLGAVLVAPFGALVLVYYALKRSLLAWSLIALVAADLWLPPGQEWPALKNCGAWFLWHRYFHLRFVTPPLPFLQEGRRYIIAQAPHAVYPMAGFLALSHCGSIGSGAPAGVKASIASVFFQLPLIKHIYAAVGAIPAERSDMMRELERGNPVAVHPEGIAGIFLGATPSREAAYLRNRKGFIKVAIEAGADIVPMYYLGQSQLLTYQGYERLSRRLKAAIGVFWGWYGTVVPRPHPLIAVVGEPIHVIQSDRPQPKEIDRLHALFLQEMQQLYEDHRHLIGWQNRQLAIC